MQKVLVITPNLDQREQLLQSISAALREIAAVEINGQGRNGITIRVPEDFDLDAALPSKFRDQYHIEEAEAPSFHPIGPRIRSRHNS